MQNADQITKNLWQGGVPSRGSALNEAGFDTLVLCAREWQLPSVYFPKVKVIHAPNDDYPEDPSKPTPQQLQTAVRTAFEVADDIRSGKKVLVTCAAGMNRSGLVTAMSLHLLYGWSGPRCVAHVRLNRTWGDDGYMPLSNPQFVRVLSRLPDQTGEE